MIFYHISSLGRSSRSQSDRNPSSSFTIYKPAHRSGCASRISKEGSEAISIRSLSTAPLGYIYAHQTTRRHSQSTAKQPMYLTYVTLHIYLTTYRVSTSRPWNIKIRFAIDTQRTEGQLATRNPHRQVTDSNATLACVTTGRTKTSPYSRIFQIQRNPVLDLRSEELAPSRQHGRSDDGTAADVVGPPRDSRLVWQRSPALRGGSAIRFSRLSCTHNRWCAVDGIRCSWADKGGTGTCCILSRF